MNGNGQMTVTQSGAELIESERFSRVREKALIGAVPLHLAGKAENCKVIAAGEISRKFIPHAQNCCKNWNGPQLGQQKREI